MIGEVIAGYRIEAAIGAELHGHAFRARNPESGETVAIKIFSPDIADTPGGLDSLFAELRASSLIKQPGLVRILDCDNTPGRPAYLIREDLKGESLRDCLNRVGNFSRDLEAIRNIITQTTRALSASHAMGLFHHCLSPETIFLTTALGQVPPFQIKLLEFGMGRLFHRQLKATLSGLQIPVDHLRYCSPEQCRGADSDQRADIYALGCILYELLTGRLPFEEATMAEMFLAHVNKRAPTLARLAPGLPAELCDLVGTMLEKEPSQRPFCIDEITAAINGILAAPQAYKGNVPGVEATMFIDMVETPVSVQRGIAQPPPASKTNPPAFDSRTRLPPASLLSVEGAARLPSQSSHSWNRGQLDKPLPTPTAAAAKMVGPGLPEVGSTQFFLAVPTEPPEGPSLASKRKRSSSKPRSSAASGREGRRGKGDQEDTFENPAPGVFNQRRNIIVIASVILAGTVLAIFLIVRSKSPTPPAAPKANPVEQEASPPSKAQPTLKIQALPLPLEDPQAEPLPAAPPPSPQPKPEAPAPKKTPGHPSEPNPKKPNLW